MKLHAQAAAVAALVCAMAAPVGLQPLAPQQHPGPSASPRPVRTTRPNIHGTVTDGYGPNLVGRALLDLPASPDLGPGFRGVKVSMVREKLGLTPTPAVVDARTTALVRTWQAGHGLGSTGVVDKATWAAMFGRTGWTLDRFQQEDYTPSSSTFSQQAAMLVGYARAQRGAAWIDGSAGPKARGFDDAGLVISAMLYAGVSPAPLNPVDLQRPVRPGESPADVLYRSPAFDHVAADDTQPGDLLFYGDRIAIVADGGNVIETTPGSGVREVPRPATPARSEAVRVVV